MSTSTFAMTIWLVLTNATVPIDPDCGRYLNAMRNTANVATLEAWRARLPKVFDPKKYARVWEYSGFGGYSFALDFDPTSLGLGPTAHAEVSFDPDTGKVQLAAISDARWTGFVFRFDEFEHRFERRAMKSPRSEHVGVACWTPRGE